MKKLLVILGMITCMACLSACGEEEAKSGPISDEQAVQIGTTIVDQMNTIVSQGAIEQYVDQPALSTTVFRAGRVRWTISALMRA